MLSVWVFRASQFVGLVEHLFDFAQNIVALSPFCKPQIRKDQGDERNHLSHRIPQQVDVGGKMHVGLYHERVATSGKTFVLFFQEQEFPTRSIPGRPVVFTGIIGHDAFQEFKNLLPDR